MYKIVCFINRHSLSLPYFIKPLSKPVSSFLLYRTMDIHYRYIFDIHFVVNNHLFYFVLVTQKDRPGDFFINNNLYRF